VAARMKPNAAPRAPLPAHPSPLVHQSTRFVLRFLIAWAVLSAGDFWARGVNAGLDRALAGLLGRTLPFLGVPSNVQGDTVAFTGGALQIGDPCNGLQLLEVLLAWLWACPATWTSRGRALLWMVPALAGLNLVRLYSLVPLTILRPEAVEPVHQYVWQVGMIGAVLAMGLLWMLKDGGHALGRGRG